MGRRALVWLLVLLAVVGWADDARARRHVEWTKVEVRAGDDAKRVARALGQLLAQASKRAQWGKRRSDLLLSARVTRLDWEEHEDVVRVNVTVMAQIEGGKSARSHIRVGGRPSERRKLERQALEIVARGLVTRLADLARREGR